MLTRPIVEGQWYLLEDNGMIGQAEVHDIGLGTFTICGFRYSSDGTASLGSPRKIRRVWPINVDPAEVVAELRDTQSAMRRNGRRVHESIYAEAADLVAEKFGIPNG